MPFISWPAAGVACLLSLCLTNAALATRPAAPQQRLEPKTWCDYTWNGAAFPPRLNLPAWACKVADARKLERIFWPDEHINPLFINGDFDGDGLSDIAVRVVNKSTQAIGVVIMHQRNKRVYSVGGGGATDGTTNLAVYDGWTLLPRSRIQSNHETQPLILKGDALHWMKSESAASLLYWNGKGYAWYRISD